MKDLHASPPLSEKGTPWPDCSVATEDAGGVRLASCSFALHPRPARGCFLTREDQGRAGGQTIPRRRVLPVASGPSLKIALILNFFGWKTGRFVKAGIQ